MNNAVNHYLSEFDSFEKRFRGKQSSHLDRLRRSSIERFSQLGFPTQKNEEWKYTNLAQLIELPFVPAAPNGLSNEKLAHLAPGLDGPRLIFVNGHLRRELSSLGRLPAGAAVMDFPTALQQRPELLEAHLGRYLAPSSSFAALNTALTEGGAVIYLPRGAVLTEPLFLIFVSSAPSRPTSSHPRNLIIAEAGSEATIVEGYIGEAEQVYFTNAVTEVILGENARLEHYLVQRQAERAFHVGSLQVTQKRDSRLVSHLFSIGGCLARSEVRTSLSQPGCSCTLNGLYMAHRRQHLDQLTSIDHASSQCTSRELYKGILDDQATGVFSGRIKVFPDAQKTDASQTNKNLLLSDQAVVDTKPQLEILADDVKCTHGAAVGQLDETALFYLRSRGVPLQEARGLLTYAFARELVGLIRIPRLKLRVEVLVGSKLPGGGATTEGE
jgi:Fe-S cluster assembly protein SufD